MAETDEAYARQVVEALLAREFPGVEALRQQWATATLAPIGDEYGSFWLRPASGERAAVGGRIPAEAEAPDADGIAVHFLLHVVEGRLSELEIYKDDGSPLAGRPTPASLEVWAKQPGEW